ncbi:HEXXH motif-containing putative peptide modification protein [Streptomyces sp. AP-93]|uniref:aKG-HExxH-type peptide beta-hydroxylase n=1 Tax=Streptomyces sp. AP-93 TaxID=2929048 RepID=UPI001FB023C2|nr:HEXXH motif-containing putative peptide modification protein [Streptomyces sp. AP-93]MCJ0875378.1 HEXXH motif-containing putative peptide modification protein [Streptomyces sp. AP-93]
MYPVTTESLFTLDGLSDHRRHRINRITAVLGAPLSPDTRGYALAHHLLEGAEQAARAEHDGLLTWYRTASHDQLGHLAEGDHLILTANPENRLRSSLSDTEYYLITPNSAPAPQDVRNLVRAALASATQHGFGPLLGEHAPIICLLDHRGLYDTLHSWTLSRLPGTVYTDYTDHPETLARDLIHEAAHNWLNDALALHEIKLPDDVTYYSPWRAMHRPVYGFLHACWAFSLASLYSKQALATAPQPAASALEAFLEQQLHHLDAAHQHVDAAAASLPSTELRARIREATVRARALLNGSARTPNLGE